jgi:hypothetical protein
MSWRYFLFMNALGGICWVLLLGGGAYLFGEEMKRVVWPVQLLLLVAAIGLAAGGIIFFRHHENELVRRAERSIPGPLLGAAGRARDVADAGREANVGGLDDDRVSRWCCCRRCTWLASMRVLETSVPRRRDLMPRAGRA